MEQWWAKKIETIVVIAVVAIGDGANAVMDWIVVAVMILSVNNNNKNNNKQLEHRIIFAFITTGSSNFMAEWNSSTVLFQQ